MTIDREAPAPATIAIAIATAVAFGLSAFGGPHLWLQAGFVPIRVTESMSLQAVPVALTPLTATLLHSGWLHLGFNMLMLVFCGRQLEGVVGSGRMLLLYALGAYGAAVAHYMVEPASSVPLIGASGAISAVLAAYALLFGRDVSRIGPIPGLVVRAAWLAAAWIAIQWLLETVAGTGANVSNAGHVGGFIVGLIAVAPMMLRQLRAIGKRR